MNLSNLVQEAKEKFQKVTNKSGVMNILEFAESKSVGLGLTLYPVQKFILKLFSIEYGLL